MKLVIPLAIGIAIVAACLVLTVWNERRASGASDLRSRITAELLDISAERITDEVEGRFVRIVGTTSAGADVREPILGQHAPVLRLDRIVETAQWQERQIVTQGGRDLVYEVVWSAIRIDSSRFRDGGGAHPNPPLRIQSEKLLAPTPKLGAWSAEPAVWHAIPATETWMLPEQVSAEGIGPLRRFGEWWWSGNPERPAPGDVRLHYRTVPHGVVTMIGRAASGRITAPVDEVGNALPLAGRGDLPPQDIVGEAGKVATIEAWKVRALALAGFLLGSLILASTMKRFAPEVLGRFVAHVPSFGGTIGMLVWLASSITIWLLFRLR